MECVHVCAVSDRCLNPPTCVSASPHPSSPLPHPALPHPALPNIALPHPTLPHPAPSFPPPPPPHPPTGSLGRSLLGYGDVGVPGLLVALCLQFDLQQRPHKRLHLYYLISGVGKSRSVTIGTCIRLFIMLHGLTPTHYHPLSVHRRTYHHIHCSCTYEESTAGPALFSARHPGSSDLHGTLQEGILSLLHREASGEFLDRRSLWPGYEARELKDSIIRSDGKR